uniref:Uncharacterized protein LOC111125923 isoform X2 n=1 Tax=Crassostrea virginica TaxID=6565 RepID=A0A8B8DE97_CRAVI|nr:uncharacterized protein LOC111125923 isoform X2 [Crassostrea virginica]
MPQLDALQSMVIVIALNVIHQSKEDCVDDVRKPTEGQNCCTNYHMVGGFCEACPLGYFGNNCSVQCPGRSFGLFCGETCNCSKSECNPALGCLSEMSTHWLNYSEIFRHRNTRLPDTTYRPSIPDATTEFGSKTLILIIGGVVILFLLIIILIQVHGKVTRMKNTFKSMPIKDNEKPLQQETSTNAMYCEIDESEEPSVPRARYETIRVNSPPPENRYYDIPLTVIHPDASKYPLGPLKKEVSTRFIELDDSSIERGSEHEISGSNSSSSDGSYLKPLEEQINPTEVIDIDEGDNDGSSKSVCLPNIPGNRNGTSIYPQDNPYLDVIS